MNPKKIYIEIEATPILNGWLITASITWHNGTTENSVGIFNNYYIKDIKELDFNLIGKAIDVSNY